MVGALGACSDSTGPERLYFGPSFAAGPENVISGEATVRATGYQHAFLRYTDGTGEVRESPLYPFGPDSTSRPALLGLSPETSYEIDVVLSDPGELSVETLSLTTEALPEWLPAVTPVGTDTTPGFLTLSVPDGPVIVDNAGRVVWYRYDPDITLVNFQAHPAGIYTSYGLTNDVRAYRVLDELGRETGRIRCVEYETRPHEIRVLADGRALVMCDDVRTEDLSPYGGSPTAQVNWTVVQRLAVDGSLEWEWHTADHFDVTDTSAETLEGITVLNLTHGNSIDIDPDGNYLFSFRNLNEVTRVNATTGEIQLLDNSNEAPSRLLRYRLDESAKTATLVWEYIDGPEIHALVGGSTQVYADGGGLVSIGREGRVAEVDAFGDRRWELTGIDDLYVFRSERISSLYASGRSP